MRNAEKRFSECFLTVAFFMCQDYSLRELNDVNSVLKVKGEIPLPYMTW